MHTLQDLKRKRKSFEDGLKNRLVEVEKKEAEINHMEEKVAKREQALEKKTEKLKEKEKIALSRPTVRTICVRAGSRR